MGNFYKQALKQVINTGYVPRPFQKTLHKLLKRFNVLICHRRFGKTVFCINEMIDKALRNPLKNPTYAYIAPTYAQAEKIAWQYFKDYTKDIPGVEYNEGKLRLTLTRPHLGDKITIYLLGAENHDAIRGLYLDGVILDEYADMHPDIWGKVVFPTLTDRKGWVIFIGTPKGMNHFYDIFSQADNDEWYRTILKASETQVIDEAELDIARKTMTEDEFNQEFECSFAAALVGAYFGKQMETAEKEKRVCSVPYEQSILVDTFWDLGIGDYTCIWFVQQFRNEVRLIDYYEANGYDIAHFAKVVRSKPYVYQDHYLPHDGAAKELGTGKTTQEMLRPLLGRSPLILPRLSTEDQVNAARLLLNKCWFDEEKTKAGREALKNYQKKWDAKNKVFLNTPLHNWASHGADAFKQVAIGLRPQASRVKMSELPREANREYNVFGW